MSDGTERAPSHRNAHMLKVMAQLIEAGLNIERIEWTLDDDSDPVIEVVVKPPHDDVPA